MMNQSYVKNVAASKEIRQKVAKNSVRAAAEILITMLLKRRHGTPPAYLPIVSNKLKITWMKITCQLSYFESDLIDDYKKFIVSFVARPG